MPPLRHLAWILLLAAGCGGGDEALAPTPVCATAQQSSGWPAEPGVLRLDAPLPPLPFTPAPHRAFPALAVEEPVVLGAPRIVTIVAADDPLAGTLRAFADAVPSSAWWTAVGAEYQVGTPSRGVHVVGPPQSGTMTAAAMTAYVNAAAGAAGAAPDGQTIFLLFLSPGVEVMAGPLQNCGCTLASGAHFRLAKGKSDALAWVQRCRPDDVDALTVTASHELIEAATDPTVVDGFVQRAGKAPWSRTVWAAIQPGANELADRCEGTRVHEGAWEYQRSWSNLAAAAGGDPCAPALEEPYFNVTAGEDWYPVKAGETVQVELTGWSTAPREDWFVYPRLAPATEARFVARIDSDESADASGVSFHGIGNGKKATLTVTAPDAPSGAYAVVRVVSRPSSPGSDTLHFWPVGFHIP